MALELPWPVVAVAVLSWVLSLPLLVSLWRSDDLLAIKCGLSFLLLAPVFGLVMYFWVRSWPQPMHPDLRDRWGRGADLTHMWRNWFESAGKLPPLVQHWRKRRRK